MRYKSNSSGIKGVTWDAERNKWLVSLRVDGVKTFLGRFDDLQNAKLAIEAARTKHHKEFGRHV